MLGMVIVQTVMMAPQYSVNTSRLQSPDPKIHVSVIRVTAANGIELAVRRLARARLAMK